MPQGLLQVDRFVTPQNLMRTVSGAKNRTKSNRQNYVRINLTHSIICSGNVTRITFKPHVFNNLSELAFVFFFVMYITSQWPVGLWPEQGVRYTSS